MFPRRRRGPVFSTGPADVRIGRQAKLLRHRTFRRLAILQPVNLRRPAQRKRIGIADIEFVKFFTRRKDLAVVRFSNHGDMSVRPAKRAAAITGQLIMESPIKPDRTNATRFGAKFAASNAALFRAVAP